MLNHENNLVNLKKILVILNKLPNIPERIPLDTLHIIEIYRGFFILFDILSFIHKINHSNRTKKQKIKKISKIKDKKGKYIFKKKDVKEIYPYLPHLNLIFYSKQKGGGNPLYILSHLEDTYGDKATLAFEIISSVNSNISYICSMIVSTLGYPPFSVPPMSLSIFIPKTILRLTKFFFIGYNILVNISRQNWSPVIKNFLASFPQFLITENAVSTQLSSVNKVLKLINKNFETFSKFSIPDIDKNREKLNKQLQRFNE